MSLSTSVLVSMAEIEIARNTGRLTCLGLGSCVAVCALDPIANVGGMMHVMLPHSVADKEIVRPGKYADTGIAELLARLEQSGADRSRLAFAMAGGARIGQSTGVCGDALDFGGRNCAAISEQFELHGLRLVADDLGGNLGRMVHLTIETGEVVVRTVTGGEHVLCNLRG